MLTIALCDDCAEDLENIAALLGEYQRLHPENPFQLTRFHSGNALLSAAACDRFDLYLLDVLMKGADGIQTGLHLRRRGATGEIIYITTTRDFAVESYQAQAFSYLVKPVTRAQLFSVLDQAIGQRWPAEHLVIRTPDGDAHISLRDVLYVERTRRVMCYHMTDGRNIFSITLRVPFREAAAPLLAYPQFVLCGASFVLNLAHVNEVEPSVAVLDDGSRVPIPRRLNTQVKRAWIDYWLTPTPPLFLEETNKHA